MEEVCEGNLKRIGITLSNRGNEKSKIDLLSILSKKKEEIE